MNQLRHNFIKADSLSSQIINFLNHHLGDSSDINYDISYDIYKLSEKPWQSTTYDGNIHIYNIMAKWPNKPKFIKSSSDYLTHLNALIQEYEFPLLRSFVAEIDISHLHIMQNGLDIETRALIIYEE